MVCVCACVRMCTDMVCVVCCDQYVTTTALQFIIETGNHDMFQVYSKIKLNNYAYKELQLKKHKIKLKYYNGVQYQRYQRERH